MKCTTTALSLIGIMALSGVSSARPGSTPATHGAPTPTTKTRHQAQDVPADVSAGEATFAAANNRFAFKLFKQIAEGNQDGNLVASPLSAFAALALLYNASGGDTRKEILKALSSQQLSEKRAERRRSGLL